MRELYDQVPLSEVLPEEMPHEHGSSQEPELFYCAVYEGFTNDYDCSEISVGIHLQYFINDGIPFLMPLETALERKERCYACKRHSPHLQPPAKQRKAAE